MTDHAARLRDAITSNNVHVGIIGLGYVGLPLALAFVAKGIRVTGFDVDPAKPEKLARGESYIKQIGADRIAAMAGSGRFDATTDFSRLGEPDAVLICVPTPLTPQREPDMSYVESSTRRIAACLRPGQLVVLESTTYPGTTDELVRGILEETTPHPARDARASVAGGPAHSVRYRPPEPPRESDVKSDSLNLSASRGEGMGTPGFRGSDGCCHPEACSDGMKTRHPEERSDEGSRPPAPPAPLRCGLDYFLAFSPEREDPGRKDFTTTTTPKVVGGVDPVSGDLAQLLYDQIVTRTVRVSTARAAEATKLMENIFRAVNIALVNELKVVYERMGIDIWEVLDAAATKPFGFMRFNPGPGWGGHCIPLDPFYLSWKARESGVAPKFIELAGEINVNMPHHVVAKLQLALNDCGKSVKGSKILILGVAYKKDIDDPRESPAFEIIELIQDLGADVAYHDPHIPEILPSRRHADKAGLRSVPLTPDTLAGFDAAVIVTDHTAVDYRLVASAVPVVVDSRGVLRNDPKVIKA